MGTQRERPTSSRQMDKAHTWWQDGSAGIRRRRTTTKSRRRHDLLFRLHARRLRPGLLDGAIGTQSAALKPSFGEIHFDLGHYNRAHRQFELSIAKVGDQSTSACSRWSALLLLGMATHIAADLIIHQLVNVTAGAYNLLEKTWNNEHGGDWGCIFGTPTTRSSTSGTATFAIVT